MSFSGHDQLSGESAPLGTVLFVNKQAVLGGERVLGAPCVCQLTRVFLGAAARGACVGGGGEFLDRKCRCHSKSHICRRVLNLKIAQNLGDGRCRKPDEVVWVSCQSDCFVCPAEASNCPRVVQEVPAKQSQGAHPVTPWNK